MASGKARLPYRDINVKFASDAYIFTSPSSPDASPLVIDRPTGDMHLYESTLLASKRISRVQSIAGILGIIQLRLDKYIIVITKVEPVGRLKGHQVYRIVSTDLLPLRERQISDSDEDVFISLLRNFIKSGPMYFSYAADLTNSFQRQAYYDTSLPLWMRADDRFFWNKFVNQDLIEFRRNGSRTHHGPQAGVDPYILPIIFGMLEIKPTKFRNTPLTYALITRRSRHRGGTRYFTRGIDEKGNVANYNETEQIVVLNDSGGGLGGFSGGSGMQSGKLGGSGPDLQVLSYVQTRGSVPVYWSEINTLSYTPKLQVKAIDTSMAAAKAHFDEQVRLYGDNYLVNLVNQKGRERQVKEAYEELVEKLVKTPIESTTQDERTSEKFHVIEPTNGRRTLDRVHYIYFDFHAETKGLQMHRAQLLVDRMLAALEAQQYFRAFDMPASLDGRLEVRNHQTSVVRTNCMDCLDRTNVVQSMLARWTLDRMFVDLGILQRGETFSTSDPDFEFMFRNIWADNADIVSKSYSGTGAMKTDLTRTGKRTKAGTLQDGNVAVTRYYKNNFLDGPRQDAFDLFLGVYQPSAANIGTSLVFADRRPLLIQSIPYVLAFAVFFVMVGLFTPRNPEAGATMSRFFVLFFTGVAGWSLHFILSNGMLYVNWPKLNPRPYALEGFQDTMTKVRKDKLIGQLVVRHERGQSTARYSNAEEGKKRIE
ncbi:putative sac1 protein [Zalerion maritima]|uniref:Sac1 protein n=1 Tax=Zalerion maritima TaxID=339359 RepID=A0AAD5RL48_9PEZI|nr:putative sac1 protein [Zalerion maritima]